MKAIMQVLVVAREFKCSDARVDKHARQKNKRKGNLFSCNFALHRQCRRKLKCCVLLIGLCFSRNRTPGCYSQASLAQRVNCVYFSFNCLVCVRALINRYTRCFMNVDAAFSNGTTSLLNKAGRSS